MGAPTTYLAYADVFANDDRRRHRAEAFFFARDAAKSKLARIARTPDVHFSIDRQSRRMIETAGNANDRPAHQRLHHDRFLCIATWVTTLCQVMPQAARRSKSPRVKRAILVHERRVVGPTL